MQIHGPSVTAGEISVRLNTASRQPFAVIDFGFGSATIHVGSLADASELIKAATEARDLLLSETSESGEPVTDGRWCPAKMPSGADRWQCTLAGGHEGRHEARGVFPMPFWYDGDTSAEYDETAGTGVL